MDNFTKCIQRNNLRFDRTRAESVLILYEYETFFIGDSLRIFGWLGAAQAYFTHARIEVNCVKHHKMVGELLRHNPYVARVSGHAWENLDFAAYSLVITITNREAQLRKILEDRYRETLAEEFWTAVYSCPVLQDPYELGKYILPVYHELIDQVKQYKERANALFVTDEEKAWADGWLRENGLRETDNLLIILDSTSSRSKFLRMDVHCELLEYFLSRENAKVLIFDEQGKGKKMFYTQWLGAALAGNLIVSEKMSLREAVCLLGSSYAKLIFGPSTGLLHCASGIYNTRLKAGMRPADLPIMITYVGYDALKRTQANEWDWWGGSLVNCILLRKDPEGRKEIHFIEEHNQTGLLPCQEFTSELLLDFVGRNYREKLIHLGLN